MDYVATFKEKERSAPQECSDDSDMDQSTRHFRAYEDAVLQPKVVPSETRLTAWAGAGGHGKF